ncbi:MAG: DNA replication/repair protein RecF [Hyphomicrobiaceae bacterium]|nr:DNA replication/repair protein RecF [Hyphomicrobiaceae bacterium]
MPRRSIWVERLSLSNFRNYAVARLDLTRDPVVLIGPNGAGKTNLLEAVSLLAPGLGLRRAPFAEVARLGGLGDWAVAARVHTPHGAVDIGTGRLPGQDAAEAGYRTGRLVRIDGITQPGSGALAEWVEMVWLTPAMDGLFTGPASERRAFLDRLTLCFDPGYRTRAGQFERAMRQRNRLLQDGVADEARFAGLELIMAETGTATAATRAQAAAALEATIAARRERDPNSPFPWSRIALDGWIEQRLAELPAVDVEDAYLAGLRSGRERDRAAGRTLVGPHRMDMTVEHGPKAMPAQHCSTGEQKALLIGLVLAHAELLTERRGGAAPILLLDEIAAHLDASRRAALFAEVLRLGAQAWMTGTDRHAFAALEDSARFLHVEEGRIQSVT